MRHVQVAKLSLVEGQRRQAPPEMGEISARDGNLYILVEVSAPTDSWDRASKQIVSKAISTFAKSRMGETSALQAAAEAINDMLLAKNQELPREEHVWAGFNAVYMRGDDLFLAQAGPALTYITRNDSITRFPKSFNELQSQRMEALIPLGERATIRCRLAHFQLEPGDMITMAASHLPTLSSEEAINDAMRAGSTDEVVARLQALTHHNDFSACVIHIDPPEPAVTVSPSRVLVVEADEEEENEGWEDDAPVADSQDSWVDTQDEEDVEPDAWEEPGRNESEQVKPAPRPARPSGVVAGEPYDREKRGDVPISTPASPQVTASPPSSTPRYVPGTAEPREPRPRRVKAPVNQPETSAPDPPEERPSSPFGERAAAYAAQASESVRALDWQSGTRRIGAMLVTLAEMLLAALSAVLLWWKEHIAPRVGAAAPALDRMAYGFWQAAHHAGYHLSNVLRGVLPGDRPAPPRRRDAVPPPPGDGSGFLKSAAILLPLMLVLAVLLISWRAGDDPDRFPDREEVAAEDVGEGVTAAGSEGADSASLIAQAQQLLAEANEVDEGTARTLAERAVLLLNEALPLVTESEAREQILALQEQADALLDQASTIERPVTVTLAIFQPGSDPTHLLEGNGELFLIDNARSAVYRVLVNPQQSISLEQIEPLLRAQQTLSTGAVMGTPSFLTWVPAGGNRANDGLLILTREGQLFDLEGNTLKQSDFAVVASQGFASTDGYGGNFYLLDPTNKQIWKYVPDASGQYGAAPEAWLEQAGQQQFGSPIDMAIDGFIFLLDQNGQVTRFQVGEPRSGFALDPLPSPLDRPVAMAKAPPESTDLYIADAQRVVRFDQDGRFLVEYRAPLGQEWGTIRDIAIDPKQEMLYVMSDRGLYMVDIRGTRQSPAEQ